MKGLRERLAVVARYRRRNPTSTSAQTAALAWALAMRPPAVRWRPRAAKIEITTRCNIHCTFCHLAEADGGAARAGHVMSIETFTALLNGLPELRFLDIQGVGEPLAHPALAELLHEVERRGIRVELTTNGLLLQRSIAQQLARVAYRVTVSLPAARSETQVEFTGRDELRRVVSNTRAFRDLCGTDGPEVRVSHVPLAPSVDEAPEIVDKALDMGATLLMIARYQEASPGDPLTPDPARLAHSVAQARARAKQVGLPVVVQDTTLARGSTTAPQRCHWPWSVPMIDVRGQLRPCCYAPRGPALGDLSIGDFVATWNGPAIRDFRSRLASGNLAGLPCATCREIP